MAELEERIVRSWCTGMVHWVLRTDSVSFPAGACNIICVYEYEVGLVQGTLPGRV